jgi:DNA-binding CsgD family transcriptional regulator
MAPTQQPHPCGRFSDTPTLANEASHIRDADSHQDWAIGPLQKILPHQALLCGQFTTHSGGYTALRSWSINVPKSYRLTISRPGYNVRSPIFERLLRANHEPQFFDAARDSGNVDPDWLKHFKRAGWRNLLMLAHVEKNGGETLLSVAGFYNVPSETENFSANLQSKVMPHLHIALSYFNATHQADESKVGNMPLLTSAERAIATLLAQGQTNKQIAKALCKSDQTIKTQLTALMRKLNVKNRAQAVAVLDARPSRTTTQPHYSTRTIFTHLGD